MQIKRLSSTQNCNKTVFYDVFLVQFMDTYSQTAFEGLIFILPPHILSSKDNRI